MARHIFHMPVRAMLDQIDSYELTEWFVYLEIERKDQEREQKRAEAAASSSNSNANTPDIPPTF